MLELGRGIQTAGLHQTLSSCVTLNHWIVLIHIYNILRTLGCSKPPTPHPVEEISTVQGGVLLIFSIRGGGDMSFLKQPIDSNVQLTVNLNL